jgi:hypothetical protein
MPDMIVPPVGCATHISLGGGFTGIAMPTGPTNHLLACEFLNKEREIALHAPQRNRGVVIKNTKSADPEFYLSSSQAMQNWADKKNPVGAFQTMSLDDLKRMTSTDVMFYKGKDNGSQRSDDVFSCLAPRDYTAKYLKIERATTAPNPDMGGGRSRLSSRSGSLARSGSALSRPSTQRSSRPRRLPRMNQRPQTVGSVGVGLD